MKIHFKKLDFVLFSLFLCMSSALFGQDLGQMRSFMQASPSPATEIPYGNNPKAGHYVKATDAKIYYEVYGKGKPLVILHGGVFGSPYEMAQFIDSLSKKYQVIAVSTRGHGRSEMGAGLPTYELKAKDVLAVINEVTKDSVTVLGFSDGAYTGYYIASLYPEKVKKLIAIGAGEWARGARSFNLDTKMAFGLDSLYWKQQIAIRPEPQKIDQWFTSLNTYYNSVEVGKDIFKSLHCPVLLMAGELDQNANLTTVIAAYHMIAKVQLGIIPNAPHPAFMVNFPAVWADIVPFLGQ